MNIQLNKQHYPLLICGAISTFLYIYLARESKTYGDATLVDLWIVFGFNGLICVATWYYYWQSRISPSITLILVFALLFRMIGMTIFPVLEDDFYRYLWDGRALIEYGTPYGVAPSEYFTNDSLDPAFENILSNINNPDIPTIYGPFLAWIFALAYLISPGELWPIKALFVFADAIAILILVSLMFSHNLKPTSLILYAWSPLILKESIITAHPDIIGVLFMMLALLLTQKKHFYWAAVAIALAVASKVFAIIIAPLLLGLFWRRWVVFVIVCISVALPLGLADAWIPEGLTAMASSWLFNAPLYSLLQPYFSITTIKGILVVIFAMAWLTVFFRKSLKQEPLRIKGDILFGLFFLCIPVLNPWYLVWFLPFAVIHPSCWVWVASLSVLLLSYVSGINLDQKNGLYNHPHLILAAEFGAIAIAAAIDYRIQKKKSDPITTR